MTTKPKKKTKWTRPEHEGVKKFVEELSACIHVPLRLANIWHAVLHEFYRVAKKECEE